MEKIVKITIALAVLGVVLNTLVLIFGVALRVEHFLDYGTAYAGLGLMFMFGSALGAIIKKLQN